MERRPGALPASSGTPTTSGFADLSSVLIASDKGLILLDGGLPQSAPLIDASIRKLGFRTEDVRFIVNSHAHFDHAGGIAALQRASRRRWSPARRVRERIESGLPPVDDPQHGFGPGGAFPAAKGVRVVSDGEILRVGDLAVTAHLTPGHTPGSTTWTWRSCEGVALPRRRLRRQPEPGHRAGIPLHGRRYPSEHRSVVSPQHRLRSPHLPCDVMVAVHPGYSGIEQKLRRLKEQPASEPFVDPGACRAYAADARKRLDERIADEAKSPAPAQ